MLAAANPIDHFSWFQKMGPLAHYPEYIVHTIFIAGFLVLLSVLAHSKLKKTQENVIPESKFSIKNIFELITEFILDLLRGLLGDKAEKYLPLIGTIFIFIFACNVIGLIPGFQPPTANINLNLAIAIIVFLYYQYCGFKEHGFSYLKHFMGPIWWLAPIMFAIEMISHIVRPISLSIRLFGNMTGDHMVLNIFSNLTYVGIPVLFLGLGLFVCLIQAFVFSLLSTIYLALATAHEH